MALLGQGQLRMHQHKVNMWNRTPKLHCLRQKHCTPKLRCLRQKQVLVLMWLKTLWVRLHMALMSSPAPLLKP
jgi:hypothetical protein